MSWNWSSLCSSNLQPVNQSVGRRDVVDCNAQPDLIEILPSVVRQPDLFHLLPFVRASFSRPRRLIAAASKSLTLPASMSFQPAPTSARSLA